MRTERPDALLSFAVVIMVTTLSLFSDAALPASAQTTAFTYDPSVSSANSILAHAPVLDNSESSANLAAAALQANMENGLPLAVRVRQVLTESAPLAIFDSFALAYVFCDFVDAERIADTKAVGASVLASKASRKAFVGDFNVYPNASVDETRPASVINPAAVRFQQPPQPSDYKDERARLKNRSGKQVAMPVLFPGAPDLRNPAMGNSGAPNIRSAMFTLPIERLTFAQLGLMGLKSAPKPRLAFSLAGRRSAKKELLPIISRFNNFGNLSLDSDGNAGNGYAFVQNAANPSNGQLISRGDFAALVMHYRLRGADNVIAFSQTSVVGYAGEQMANDVAIGWGGSTELNALFARDRYAFANLSVTIGDLGGESGDGETPRSIELAGAVWSGVYDMKGNKRQLIILLSNVSAVQKTIDFPPIGGMPLVVDPAAEDPDNATIEPGAHRLLTFTKSGKQWSLSGDTFIGLDNNRNGVGTGAADPP